MVLRIKENNFFVRENYNIFGEGYEDMASVSIRSNKAYKADIELTVGNGDYVRCYFNMLKNKYVKGFGKSIVTTVLLNKNDEIIGSIVLKTSNNKGLKYYYKEIEYNKHRYTSYEIGMGSKGYYTMLYDGDVVVGAISKDSVVYMNQDTYSLYLENNEDILMILLILTLRWDADVSEGYAESTRNGELTTKRTECIVTPQKELREKYDYAFIPRIKQMDGIVD